MAAKKPTRAQEVAQWQAKIGPMLDFWIGVLGLQNWDIGYELVDRIEGETLGGSGTLAQVTRPGFYRKGFIRISLEGVKELREDVELEHALVHELSHLHVARIMEALNGYVGEELRGLMCKAEEGLVDELAGAFVRLRHGTDNVLTYYKYAEKKKKAEGEKEEGTSD